MWSRTNKAQEERWKTLIAYDDEIAAHVKSLEGYGKEYLEEFKRAFFALDEDRSYLSKIASKLVEKAKAEVAVAHAQLQEAIMQYGENVRRQAFQKLMRTHNGEVTAEQSFAILEKASKSGFEISQKDDHTFIAVKTGQGMMFLYSNADIARFANLNKIDLT